MARIGLKTTLKYWLETSKTYHSPINLRFTWPIELTKTYLLIQSPGALCLLHLLGKVEHGVIYTIDTDPTVNPDEQIMSVEKFCQGRRIYLFHKFHTDTVSTNKIRIWETVISAPQILHVRKFVVNSSADILILKMARYSKAIADVNTGKIWRWCYDYPRRTLIFRQLSYLTALQKLIELTE